MPSLLISFLFFPFSFRSRRRRDDIKMFVFADRRNHIYTGGGRRRRRKRTRQKIKPRRRRDFIFELAFWLPSSRQFRPGMQLSCEAAESPRSRFRRVPTLPVLPTGSSRRPCPCPCPCPKA